KGQPGTTATTRTDARLAGYSMTYLASRLRPVSMAFDMMDAASYHAARDVRGARGSWLPRGRAVAPEEWRRLFRRAIGRERPAMRERDTPLVALAYAGGVRRA